MTQQLVLTWHKIKLIKNVIKNVIFCYSFLTEVDVLRSIYAIYPPKSEENVGGFILKATFKQLL